MTAQPIEPVPGPSRKWPEKNPKDFRAFLIPEERADFDRLYEEVMTTAIRDGDLVPVHEFIETWWRIAVFSMDQDRHRRTLSTIDELNRGEHVPTVDAGEILRRRLAEGR
ncbi:DUF6247 family protein [Actinocorallia populi]|uniref:DUF6247 family protein n=1 Tax=Actinocorallia populi TaxID=2079200 RepID=UPI000D087116|nr:DUF6247 family protein [Actinocorallia populi]